MKQLVKKSLIIVLIICLILIPTIINADIGLNPDDYKPDSPGDTSEVVKIGNIIVGTIRVVGSIVSVIALVVMGIKYMIGSIDERAEYKKTMIPYLIAVVLLFAGSQILSAIYNYAQNVADKI